MLTPKTPACATARPVSLVLFRQTRIMGGSIDSEETALAVVPKGAPLAVVVMTVTPLANRPITSRNTCCSTTASSGRSVLSLLVTGTSVRSSDDLVIAQPADLLGLEAQQFAQHVVGVRAQRRPGPPHPAGCLRQAREDALHDDLAVLLVGHPDQRFPGREVRVVEHVLGL